MTTGKEAASRLSETQLVDWLRLIRSEKIGPRTFRQLVNRFGGAAAALDALPELAARQAKGRAIRIAARDEVLREIEASHKIGVRFVAMSDADYPAPLREIDSAPPLIAVRGDPQSLARDCVAIVGARNASAAGVALAQLLARDLRREDYTIVSGLARGIDAAAHRASLEPGFGAGAAAVLAGGHARPYPSENIALLEQIVDAGGAVVSEMPLEWEPRGRDFPRRNRLVSGVSRAVVVVEAARKSGSLITARFAAEQGREVFAAPGSPLDPRAEGTNDLLREGANFCTGAADVTRVLRLARPQPFRDDLFSDGAPVAEEEEPLIDEIDLFSFQEAGAVFRAPRPPRRAKRNSPGRFGPSRLAPSEDAFRGAAAAAGKRERYCPGAAFPRSGFARRIDSGEWAVGE